MLLGGHKQLSALQRKGQENQHPPHCVDQGLSLHILLCLARKGLDGVTEGGVTLDGDQALRIQYPEVLHRLIICDALYACSSD